MEELKGMYLKEVAGHVVMEGDLDSKGELDVKLWKLKLKLIKIIWNLPDLMVQTLNVMHLSIVAMIDDSDRYLHNYLKCQKVIWQFLIDMSWVES